VAAISLSAAVSFIVSVFSVTGASGTVVTVGVVRGEQAIGPASSKMAAGIIKRRMVERVVSIKL